jgi:AAA domain, putative AbiEii toxin, Type IV TA system
MGRERHDLVLYLGERGIQRERLEQDPSYHKMRELWLEREKDHILLSYGPGRNLSEHLDGRHKDRAEEVRRQMTLFDPLTQVGSVEALLEAREETKVIWLLLRRLITRVLDGTTISLDPDRSSLRFHMGEATVSAVDLPDGFRATIALLADLCATWHQKAPDEARSGDPSCIRGIVLVDEIDLHLHPGLQRLLIPRLRRALPEVQWIVTTHSPLILGSFEKSEIVALEADPVHGVRLHPKLDRQILGFTTDEIYKWLMDVKPRSAELDIPLGNDAKAHARKTLILAQSPTVSEEDALANLEYRRTLAERKRHT